MARQLPNFQLSPVDQFLYDKGLFLIIEEAMLKTNEIYCGDCVELLKQAKGLPVRLIFADPPFNIGYQYDTYDDRKAYDDYTAWTESWMRGCRDVLTPDGSFYIAIGDDYAAEIRMIARKLDLHLRNWIIWHYTFGQQTKAKFARAHTHIFYFVADPKNFIFNDEPIRVPSARQLVYNDKRADSRGKIPDDVWQYSRLCGTFKEREGWHGCQMPTKLLSRIIKTSSHPGDLVLDPFSGSGTTALTAAILKREYLAFDMSENYVQAGRERIQKAREEGIDDVECDEPIFILAKKQGTTAKTAKNAKRGKEKTLF
jgi:site-specific DNA-methyltransferase (adenine-specific)